VCVGWWQLRAPELDGPGNLLDLSSFIPLFICAGRRRRCTLFNIGRLSDSFFLEIFVDGSHFLFHCESDDPGGHHLELLIDELVEMFLGNDRPLVESEVTEISELVLAHGGGGVPRIWAILWTGATNEVVVGEGIAIARQMTVVQ
jgi:hypothetical protein